MYQATDMVDQGDEGADKVILDSPIEDIDLDDKHALIAFCKTANVPEPHFSNWVENGLYCAAVSVGEEEAQSCGDFHVLAESESSAAKQWLTMFGGVKTVPISEAFSLLENKKITKPFMQKKKVALVLRRSPRKQMKMQNIIQSVKKAEVVNGLFDDSSLSIASQEFEQDVDLFGAKPEKSPVLKESKENGSQRKKPGTSKEVNSDKSDKKEKKRFIWKARRKSIESIRNPNKFPIKKVSFINSEEVKISPQESKSMKSASMRNTKEDFEQVARGKESLSSVFDVEDDPCVVEMVAREKREALKLAARIKGNIKGRKRESMAKMAEFSQSLTGILNLDECSQESTSDESGVKFKNPKLKKPRKKNKKDSKIPKEMETKKESEEVRDYTPSIDELLKLPDRPEDGGKTMDEVLDDLDVEIAERKMKHEKEMSKIDTDISAEKQRQEEWRERLKMNAVLRDRLEVEITKPVLRRMFLKNIEYLENIEAGRVESSRHKAFHKSTRTRHTLFYTMITDPFTDDQLEWTLEEMGKVWMKTMRDQMDKNDYVWKVLLAECFIKFYMDHFGFDKKEAEDRIGETPLRKTNKDGEEENTSDEEL